MHGVKAGAVAAVLALGAGGCATTSAPSGGKVPTEQLVEARAAIRSAEELGAEQLPEAAQYLELARIGARDAQKLADRGEGRQAELALLRAEADAELARAMARTAPVRAEAERLQAELQRLREEQGPQR